MTPGSVLWPASSGYEDIPRNLYVPQDAIRRLRALCRVVNGNKTRRGVFLADELLASGAVGARGFEPLAIYVQQFVVVR